MAERKRPRLATWLEQVREANEVIEHVEGKQPGSLADMRYAVIEELITYDPEPYIRMAGTLGKPLAMAYFLAEWLRQRGIPEPPGTLAPLARRPGRPTNNGDDLRAWELYQRLGRDIKAVAKELDPVGFKKDPHGTKARYAAQVKRGERVALEQETEAERRYWEERSLTDEDDQPV